MKNIIKSLALAAVVLVSGASFTACKKGENDPGISLKSRKGRLTGKWKLSKGEQTEVEGSYNSKTIFTETSATFTDSDGENESYGYTISFEFNKDGSYESIEVLTPAGSANTSTYTTKGRWYFLSANKSADTKNKESISLSPTSETASGSSTCNCTSTESNPTFGDYLQIDQLKSDEVVFISNSTETGSFGSATIKSNITFTKN